MCELVRQFVFDGLGMAGVDFVGFVHRPTVFDNSEASITVDGRETYLGLWDTAGQEGYDRLRPLSYPQTDVFIICFAINSPVSFKHIEQKWKPELNHHSPGVPFLIVGTKADVRDDASVVAQLEAKGKPLKSREHYESESEKLGAALYLECSAMKAQGLDEVFENAVRVATRSKVVKTASNGKSKARPKAKGGAKESNSGGKKDGCVIL